MSVSATLSRITGKPIGAVITGPAGATYRIGQRGRLPTWVSDMISKPAPAKKPKSVSPAADKVLGGPIAFDRMQILGMLDTCVTHIKRMGSPEVVNAAIKLLSDAVRGDVKIEVSGRCRVAAGLAKASKCYNPYTRQNVLGNFQMVFSESIMAGLTYDQRYEVVSHEFAHLIDYVVRGDSNHDVFWQGLHKMMHGSGNTYHKFEVKRNKRKRAEIVAPDGRTYRVTLNKARLYLRRGFRLLHVIEYDPNTKTETKLKAAMAKL